MRYSKSDKILFAASLCALMLIPVFMLRLDPAVMHWTADFNKNSSLHGLIDALKPLIGFISNGGTLIVSSFLVYLAGKYKNPRLHEFGRSLFIGLISAGMLVQVLKHLIGRARPRLTYDLVFIGPSLKNGYDSFPSGHTTMAFCLAFIVSRYYPRWTVVSYLFAVTVGLYRVDGFSHFPSDVLAGAMVGTLAAKLICATIVRKGDAPA